MNKSIITFFFILFYTSNFFGQENFKYDSLIHTFYDSQVVKKKDLYYIINSKSQVKDSFIEVQPYLEISKEEDYYFDENNEYVYQSPKMVQKFPEFMLVYKINSQNQREKAIYNLSEYKIISPWIQDLESQLFIENFFVNFYSKTIYTYSIGEHLGFYVKGMNLGTDLIYFSGSPIVNLWNYVAIPKRDENLKITHNLYKFENNNLNLESSEYEVSSSLNHKKSIPKIDNETGEPFIDPATGEIEFETIDMFKLDFLILKNKENKFGVISINNCIVKPQFDSINENPSVSNFITLVKKDINAKKYYGNFNVFGGEYIEPLYENELSFSKSSFLLRDYYFYVEYNDEENQNNLFNIKREKFFNTPEEVFINQQNKKFGLYTYPYLYPEKEFNKMICQVPALYKNLEQTPYKGLFKAQSKNKKWGLINFLGDTLIPLNYDRFEVFEVDAENNFSFFTFQDKKIGIFDLYKGEISPCVFDEIKNYQRGISPSVFVDFSNYPNYFLTKKNDMSNTSPKVRTKKNDKFGLLNNSGQEILPAELENIYTYYSFNGENDSYDEFFISDAVDKKKVFYFNYDSFEKIDLNKQREYDFIHNHFGYIKKNNEFEIYFLRTGEQIPLDYLENKKTFNGKNCTIIFENGKFGAKNSSDEIVIPFDYEIASFINFDKTIILGFQNGIKYYIETENFKRFTEEEWKNKQ